MRERAIEMRGYTCAARFRQGSVETQLFNCVLIRDALRAREVANKSRKVCLYKYLSGSAQETIFSEQRFAGVAGDLFANVVAQADDFVPIGRIRIGFDRG